MERDVIGQIMTDGKTKILGVQRVDADTIMLTIQEPLGPGEGDTIQRSWVVPRTNWFGLTYSPSAFDDLERQLRAIQQRDTRER